MKVTLRYGDKFGEEIRQIDLPSRLVVGDLVVLGVHWRSLEPSSMLVVREITWAQGDDDVWYQDVVVGLYR